MTNLQMAKEQREAGLAPRNLRRLWFWTPIGAAGLLAAAVLSSVAVPLWMNIDKDHKKNVELEQRREEADLLRLQVAKLGRDQRKAEAEQGELIELVAGPKGQASTFLATLDLEARRTGVKLQLFEPTPPAGAPGTPQAAAPPPPPPPAGVPPRPVANGQAVAPGGGDALEKAGLEKRTLLLSARGTFPQLLAFLRRMELLDVLVEQSDLSLSWPGVKAGEPVGKSNDGQLPPAVPEVEVKMQVGLYGKKDKGANVAPPGTKP
ncbi:MAG: hypothetical protein VKO19_01270 [Cyanobacteriota bacterium]|nr:hypothetical protein [Cyanobacteriota bacterium]